MLLCFNPLLPRLARILTDGALRDYSTIDELLAIRPEPDNPWVLPWSDEVLDMPFYRSHGSSELEIEKAGSFTNRLHEWGLRAGFPVPPKVHDIRAEVLYWISKYA
jgi:hypothetical protein